MSILWNTLLGQDRAKESLLQALKKKRLAPVLLFSGPSGVGKRLCALALAQALICEKTNKGIPCGACPDCFRVEEEKNENMLFISPGNLGEAIKREQASQILDFLFLKNLKNQARLILVEQIDKMNLSAANTLLKILEEPPTNSFFVFLTEKLSSLLSTLRSRSQIIKFNSLKEKDLQSILRKSESKESDFSSPPDWLKRAAQGSLERLKILTEKESLRKKAFLALDLCLTKKEAPEAFRKIEKDVLDKETSLTLTWFWQQIFRDLSFYKALHPQIQKQEGEEKQEKKQKKEEEKQDNFLIHSDQKPFFDSLIHQYPIEAFISLKQLTFQLERDVLRHVNRPLSFKNYFMQIQNKKWKTQTV